MFAICTVVRYSDSSVELWNDPELPGCLAADFLVKDERSKRIPVTLETRLFRKLQMLDDATMDADLRAAPSNHFEKLKGNLAGFHSIRVNRQWRLIFRWDGSRGEATGVYLDDHAYR